MSRENIIRFLTSSALQNVCFSFVTASRVTVTVNSTSFQRVAQNLRSGRIILEESNSFPTGVGAEYFPVANAGRHVQANTLRVRPQIGRMEQGQLLHECVHASLDLTGSPGLSAAQEEAAAYIAEYVYYRRTGLSPGRVVRDAITLAARPIADAVVRRHPITTAQVTALANAVAGHPVYRSMPSSYTHDG